MAWIESHTVLIRHRKVVNLSLALRLRKSYTIGHLHALWHAALEQQDDGDLSAWSDEFIADQSDYPGDAPQFVRLLQSHGFFGYRDGAGNIIPGTEKVLHDWWIYAKSFLEGRYRRNPAKRKEIEKKHSQHCLSSIPCSGVPPDALPSSSGAGPEPLPLPTNQPTNQPTRKRVVPDGTSEEVDRYIGGHPGLNWSPVLAAKMRKLVDSAGWEQAKTLIDEACAIGAHDPVAYAGTVHTGNLAKARLGKGKNGQPAAYVPVKGFKG